MPELGPTAMQTLALVRSMPAGEPYIARGCRRKVARQLAARTPPLLDVQRVDRGHSEEWLACTLTIDGHVEIDNVLRKLRERRA